jgi:hypothetical protein
VDITDLTPYIHGLLTKSNASAPGHSTEHQNMLAAGADSGQVGAGLEHLPVELIQHISSFLSVHSVFALRLTSKGLAACLHLDSKFWFQHLASGSLVPYLWDLDAEVCHGKYLEAAWDWKLLAKLLSRTDDVMKASDKMADAPIGLRNRCRIWKIVDGALDIQAFDPPGQ